MNLLNRSAASTVYRRIDEIFHYGKGRNSYRILFSIVESEEMSAVRILHIRHAAQQTIGENQDFDRT
jgi:hypothetical protein